MVSFLFRKEMSISSPFLLLLACMIVKIMIQLVGLCDFAILKGLGIPVQVKTLNLVEIVGSPCKHVKM